VLSLKKHRDNFTFTFTIKDVRKLAYHLAEEEEEEEEELHHDFNREDKSAVLNWLSESPS
jgi:hypothetical protein